MRRVTLLAVIDSFGDADTQTRARGPWVGRFESIESVARRKLRQSQIAGRRTQAAYDSEVAEEVLVETLSRIKPWSGAAA